MIQSTARKRTIPLSPKSSFLALIQDAKDLVLAFPRGRAFPGDEVRRVLVLEATQRIPQAIRQMELQDAEILFLAVVVIEPKLCRDSIRTVARFLSLEIEGTLLLEMQLRRSMAEGALKPFITYTGEFYDLLPEAVEKVYAALADGKEES